MTEIVALRGQASDFPAASRRSAAALPEGAPIAIEIRALSACAGLRSAWSDLAARALVPNLFFGPDFALAAVQHLVAFRDVVVILAWQGESDDPRRRLVGFMPCVARDRLFAPDALQGFADRRVLDGAPLLDAALAGPVLAAILSPRRSWRLEGRGLSLPAIDLGTPLVTALLRAAEPLGLSATLAPTPRAGRCRLAAASLDKAVALRAALSRQGQLEIVETGARLALRDAVEEWLAIDASGAKARAGRAVLQDTREAAFLRAMTRGLAQSRQCRVALLRLDGVPIAGAILLGKGERRWLYAATADDAFSPFEPELVLLAMLRRAAPKRTILLPGGAAALGDGDAAIGELRLSPGAALKPRDLALRARDALRRSLFRLPRAGSAG